MKIEGKVEVTCSACGERREHALVQLVNAQGTPEARARLLRGELNLATCACGKVTQLACELVYQDPQLGLLCHVCPGGEAAMQRAEALFESAFAAPLAAAFAGAASPPELPQPTGAAEPGARPAAGYPLQRIVPSQNALVEKVKILEAGLDDWAVEMVKVLLLASIAVDDDDRVMLFVGVDEDAQAVQWLLFDAYGEVPTALSSPLAAVQRLVATAGAGPAVTQRRIDRAWAIEAVRAMIAAAN